MARMAWRIHDSVIRGEIDNRRKGRIRGTLWLAGLATPLTLELTGNACADLAGCLLTFTNRHPALPLRQDATLATVQRGRIGDLTASRKVRVDEVPNAEARARIDRGQEPPERLANALYLEWFSDANGRVVIETTGFDLDMSLPEWQPGPEDETQRQADAAAGWSEFVNQLGEAVERHQRGARDPAEEWDEHDCERFLKAADARTDKYAELLDKYGHSEEAHEIIAREMGWIRELTDEEAEEEQRRIDEMNAACEAALDEPPPEPEPRREGIDWIRVEGNDIRHPLQHRAFEAALNIRRACRALGLEASADDDLHRLLFGFQITSAKLAGALGTVARGVALPDPAFTVAYLKRALDHLHQTQVALETVATKPRLPDAPDPLLPTSLAVEARRELFEIREAILHLMQQFRKQQ
jgi:hypothetical protein